MAAGADAMEQTYLMIKPEILAATPQRIGEILAMITGAGFRILEMSTRRLDHATAERFYAEHKDRPFFRPLIDYITSGPVLAVRLERDDAVSALRKLIGATNPAEAGKGTVRALYGTSLQKNAVHGSATVADSQRELALIFGA
jgi:nucleoside-diphosphate kinase